MKRSIFLLALVVFASLGAMAQNADFTHISGLNSVLQRRLYILSLDPARVTALVQYHIDEKRSQWDANSFQGLSQAQTDALNALKTSVTVSLVTAAKNTPPGDPQFASFGNALTTVETLFTSGQLTELKIVGDYDSNDFDFAQTWEKDVITGEFATQCAKGRICYIYCNCNVGSWCGTACLSTPNCTVNQGGCGCFSLWECNGFKLTTG